MYVHSSNPPWMNQGQLKKIVRRPKWSKFIIWYVSELLLAVCRIISKTYKKFTTNNIRQVTRGKLIIKHAQRKFEFICLHQCFLWWLSCDASSHFHFWSASLDTCYCEWHLRSTSENLSRRMQPQTKSLLNPFCMCMNPKPDLWKLYGVKAARNPQTSTQLILFVVRMWLQHHLLSLKIRYRGRLGRGPVFSERFCPRKKKKSKSPPKFKPLRD